MYLIPYTSTSQTYNFRNYSVDDGLPFIQVSTIFQDSKGYLWSGGYGGLSRFDGKNFVNYAPKDGLADHAVNCITEDTLGNIWIGTISGLSIFDGKKFSNYTVKDGLPSNQVNALLRKKDGQVIVGTARGIVVIDRDGKIKAWGNDLSGKNIRALGETQSGKLVAGTGEGYYEFGASGAEHLSTKAGLSHNRVNAFAFIRQATEWVGTDSGLCKREGDVFTSYHVRDGLPDEKINALTIDLRGILWIGTDKGLCRYDPGTGNKNFFTYTIGDNVNGSQVRCLFVDYEGNLWIGTYSGLYRYRGDTFTSFGRKEGLTNTFVSPICAARGGGLWLGTLGGGIFRYIDGKFTNYTTANGLSGNEVNACVLDPDSNLWVGTNKGLTKVIARDGAPVFKNYAVRTLTKSDSVTAIMRDKNGLMWLGSRKSVLRYDPAKGEPLPGNMERVVLKADNEDEDFYIYAIHQDNTGRIWFGSFLGGVYWLDPADPTATVHDFSKENPAFKSRSVLGIVRDYREHLFFGTMDGVFRFDPSKGVENIKEFVPFSEKEGLNSDLVYSLVSDDEGKTLWVGTNQGLNKIDIARFDSTGLESIEPYGKEEGFLGVECNTGTYRERGGAIWFGTVNGLIRYNPGEFIRNTSETKTNITGFRIFYTDTILPDNVKLNWYDNNISFDFIGICLTNPSKVRYSFMLEGSESGWSPETKNTFARFSNLGPGTYTFKVKSRNNEGVWNVNPAAFTFTVLTPWWKTWWFRILLIMTVVSGVYFAVRFRVRQIEINEHNKVRLANNELKALRAQMNPHFIFNALNSIQHFIMSSDEQGASKYLNKFAKLIRSILNNTEKTSVSLKDEVESLRLYIELEMLRFENKFDYEIKVDTNTDLDFYEVPTLLLQPYVENAIIHGLVPKKEKGMLNIEIKIENNFILCTITDNGIGRKRSAESKANAVKRGHKSLGMKITRDRLELLNSVHNSSLSVNITDLYKENGEVAGTSVEIFIPIV